MTIREAACGCGQLRVQCGGEPHRRSMCHCLACQRRTGSAFGVQVWYRAEQISGISGEARQYSRLGDSGKPIVFHFCPTCGSTVYWKAEVRPGSVAIAVGAFADPQWPAPDISVYEGFRHRWVQVDPALPMKREN